MTCLPACLWLVQEEEDETVSHGHQHQSHTTTGQQTAAAAAAAAALASDLHYGGCSPYEGEEDGLCR